MGSVKQIFKSGKVLDAVIAAETEDNDPPRISTSHSKVLVVVDKAAVVPIRGNISLSLIHI